MICRLAFWEDCSGGELVRGGVRYSGRQSVLNGKEWRLVMLQKCRSKLWRIQSFLFRRMLQSVFLMMEGGSGGITISGLRLMISVRLPLFDSEPGTRRNRIWDETQPNLGRDTTASGTWHKRIWDGVRWQVWLMDCRAVGCVVAMAGNASGFLLLFEDNGRLAFFLHRETGLKTEKYRDVRRLIQIYLV